MAARIMRSRLVLLFLMVALTGCRHYADSTPRHFLEGDDPANYKRVFKSAVPKGVTVVHSVVVGYAWRPGVVTTDDFEFELLATKEWIGLWAKKFWLMKGDSEFIRRELGGRKERSVRTWYAPESIDSYELYRDCTNVGYAHMLVDKEKVGDRRRVFFSKH